MTLTLQPAQGERQKAAPDDLIDETTGETSPAKPHAKVGILCDGAARPAADRPQGGHRDDAERAGQQHGLCHVGHLRAALEILGQFRIDAIGHAGAAGIGLRELHVVGTGQGQCRGGIGQKVRIDGIIGIHGHHMGRVGAGMVQSDVQGAGLGARHAGPMQEADPVAKSGTFIAHRLPDGRILGVVVDHDNLDRGGRPVLPRQRANGCDHQCRGFVVRRDVDRKDGRCLRGRPQRHAQVLTVRPTPHDQPRNLQEDQCCAKRRDKAGQDEDAQTDDRQKDRQDEHDVSPHRAWVFEASKTKRFTPR